MTIRNRGLEEKIKLGRQCFGGKVNILYFPKEAQYLILGSFDG